MTVGSRERQEPRGLKNSAPAGASAPRTDLFSGGGEMGELMRAYDWSATPLGPPETWSQSLRVVVRIMLLARACGSPGVRS